ncbi:hypothetical protein ODJ79_04500 [Actinoplanes sp. KI2]|uniref:hypothetical protein n=1 Tax=Actinoplanes sp. KI2 TaxID=2983315 RepID=UPI0021D5F5E4|nr:hypothetical protein [Actinoplanes sp. KI2]MCU7722967.1 hypothetical protein [Actinoplanes sp. KI2]
MKRLASVVAGVVVAAAALWIWHVARTPAGSVAAAVPVPVGWARPAVAPDDLGQASGVTITRVAVTAGGGLVDLRFRVVDPDRAHALHDPATPPAVVDEASGLVVHDLLMNHEHTGDFRAGATYYLVFTNPGNWVRRGARVTVLLGNAQVEHVAVV